MFNMFAGGAVERMAIFALNIMPYISASIIMQLMSSMSPKLEALKKEGEQGRKQINQYTRYLTVVLAAFQAYGIAIGLEGSQGAAGPVVMDPGWFFRITTVITLVGGTLFLMWLGEQITQRGVGNGISLIIFAGIVAGLPSALVGLFELARTGSLSVGLLLALLAPDAVRRRRHRLHGACAAPPADPVSETTGRQPDVPGRFLAPAAEAQLGRRHPADLRLLAAAAADHRGAVHRRPGSAMAERRRRPRWAAASRCTSLLYVALIIFFAFFYTAVVFNPKETADNLRKYGGFLPGIRPGEKTAEYIDYVLTRITVVGAIYLAAVCVLPEILISYAAVPFYFGGTSLLIAVSVTMDTVAQVQSHLLAHQYEGLIKKAKLRGATASEGGDEPDPAGSTGSRQRDAGRGDCQETRAHPAFDRRHAAGGRQGRHARSARKPAPSWKPAGSSPTKW